MERRKSFTPPIVLLVGGTDPSGGAGLAADIKAVAAAGAHGAVAVTAVTIQNSGSVEGWESMPPSVVRRQIEAVLRDGPVGAVKSGMLGGTPVAMILAGLLETCLAGTPFVLDPVLVAGSGDPLHAGDMPDTIRRHLVPLCALCTPNLDEAQALTGSRTGNRLEMERAAEAIAAMGAGAVLVKGGHLKDRPADFLLTGDSGRWFEGRRTWDGKLHGTGCTLASSIAARLASGWEMEESVAGALHYLGQTTASYFHTRNGALLGHFPTVGPRGGGTDATAFYSPPRFCSRCGSELAAAPESGHSFCPECGYVHYRNPLPAVTVVARKEGTVLLVKRAVAPRKGLHCLPGGFLEMGETAEGCARRELLEETGLAAAAISLTGMETDETEYGGIMLAVMEASGLTGIETPGDDASELGWFPLDALPELAFSAHERIIARLVGEDGGPGRCL